jgi:predicted kinase
MCVGFTHNGKTTFAKKFVNQIKNFILVDNDDVASFINKTYPLAVFSDYNKIKRTYKEPNLKFLLSQDIFKFCLKAGLNVIHCSGNLGKNARLEIIKNAKKYNYELITIYFNLSREVILERLHHTKKDTIVFKSAKKWSEVLVKQDLYAELPPSQKNTIYFEIRNPKEYKEVFNKVKELAGKTNY